MVRAARNPPHVLIAGAGIAALETLLGLRALIGHQVRITLLAPERSFLYRPVTVAEAFGQAEARSYDVAAIAAQQDAQLVPGTLAQVDASARAVMTGAGRRLRYDKLVLATGCQARDPFPGALTFGGRDAVSELQDLLRELDGGRAGSVAFALPSRRAWPLPLYELALMTADHLRAHGEEEVSVSIVTPEAHPLELFGPAASQAVAALLNQRTIEVHRASQPVAVHPRSLLLAGGGLVFVDRVVSLPVPVGPAVPGAPRDGDGFIPVDEHGRVRGCSDIFAAGDVTAFPLKQGGLASQQADAVAEQIAADMGVGISPQPFRPVLRGLLMTGGSPVYLRAEPWGMTGQSELVTSAQRPAVEASAATGQPLWWPPTKVAGRYLAPYLATGHPQLTAAELSDRHEVPGRAVSQDEQRDALDLSLILADLDAKWGDYRGALEALEAAEAVLGALPPEYEARRRRWQQAARMDT